MPATATPGRVPLLVVVVPGGGGDPRDGLGLARAARGRGLALLYPTEPRRLLEPQPRPGRRRRGRRHAGSSAARSRAAASTRAPQHDGRLQRRGVRDPPGLRAARAVRRRGARLRGLPCPGPVPGERPHVAPRDPRDLRHVVPYNGKRPGREGSVPRFAARWARRVGCAAPPLTTSPRARVTRITYRGCDDGLRVGRRAADRDDAQLAGRAAIAVPVPQPVRIPGDPRGRLLRARRAPPVSGARAYDVPATAV